MGCAEFRPIASAPAPGAPSAAVPREEHGISHLPRDGRTERNHADPKASPLFGGALRYPAYAIRPPWSTTQGWLMNTMPQNRRRESAEGARQSRGGAWASRTRRPSSWEARGPAEPRRRGGTGWFFIAIIRASASGQSERRPHVESRGTRGNRAISVPTARAYASAAASHGQTRRHSVRFDDVESKLSLSPRHRPEPRAASGRANAASEKGFTSGRG